MAYRRREYEEQAAAPELPPPAMYALEEISADGPHDAHRALDTVPVSGARVLLGWGLCGAPRFMIPDGDDVTYSPGDRVYPDADTPRTVARAFGVLLSPGVILALELLAIPSGPIQRSNGASGWEEDGRGGAVKMTVIYENADGDSLTRSCEIEIAGSDLEHGAEPADCHEAIEAYRKVCPLFGIEPSAADLEKFARGVGVTATVTVTYTGSPRVVSLAVVEHASEIVVDTSETDWPSAMYAEGKAYGQLPSDYPIAQLGDADPGGGTAAIARAIEAHGRLLGPCLAWWSSSKEDTDLEDWISYDSGTGDDEGPAATSSSTSFVSVPFTFAGSPNQHLPAWLLGHHARQVEAGDEVLDGRTGVLPVWLVVYAKATDAVFQLRTGDDEWSAIQLEATGGAWAAKLEPGWVEVGLGPEDSPPARLYARTPGGNAWLARAAGLFMRDQSNG